MMLLDKTVEIRPDLPGMLFWLLTLIFLIKGMKSKRSIYYTLSGGAIALAILCTQKMLFGGIGLSVSMVWLLVDRRTGNTLKESAKALPWMALGFAIPVAITSIYFGVNQALDDFVYRNFTMNFRWQHETPLREVWGYVLYNIQRNPFFSVFSLTGLAVATYRLMRKEDILRGAFVPVISTYALIGGTFLIPEAYPQYFVFFLILLAIFCGLTVTTIMNTLSLTAFKDILRERKSDLAVYFLIGATSLCALGYALAYSKPKLPFLSRLDLGFLCLLACWPASKQVPHSGLIYIALWACLLIGALWIFLHKWQAAGDSISKQQVVTFLLLIGIFMYPLSEAASQVKRTNTRMLEEIRFVLDNTTEDDFIIDGFHGAGVFRPHTYYYHFVHVGVRMMMTEKELSTDIVSAMREKRPKIVVYDGDLRATSEAVRRYVQEHYRPTGVGHLYILKNSE